MSLEPLKFLVHRVSSHPLERTVLHEGEELRATVNSVEIELSSPEGHGTLTLRFVGKRADDARKIFHEGHIVSWPLDGIDSTAPDDPDEDSDDDEQAA